MKNHSKLIIALLSLALMLSVSAVISDNVDKVAFATVSDYNLIESVAPIGDGLSANTAYEISNIANIKWLDERTIANETENKFYKLVNDIDLTEIINFRPIGQGTTSNSSFKGTFDGNVKVISNLTYNNAKTNIPDGFFGTIENASIKNLTLKNFKFSDENLNSTTIGIFAGEMKGNSVLSYCTAESDINLNDTTAPYKSYIKANTRAGGLVGYMTGGKIEYCRTNIQLKANSVVGGLVGEVELKNGATANNVQITNSYSIGNIVRSVGAVGGNFGGLVGKITNPDSIVYRVAFSKCYFGGIMDVNIDNMGALLGINKTNLATFNGCYYYNGVFSSSGRHAYPDESGDINTQSRQNNEMRNPNALSAFDFSTVWVINNSVASDAVATFGKFPDFAKYYDTVLISAKLNGETNSNYCNLNSDRLIVKGENIELSFNPMEGARIGSVTVNGVDYTNNFYQANTNGVYVKDGSDYVPYNSSIHGSGVTKYNAVNSCFINNIETNLNINYKFIERTVRLDVDNEIENTLRIVKINGEPVSSGTVNENVLYNSLLEFQLTIPYGYKIKTFSAIDGNDKTTSLKLDSNNHFTVTMTTDTKIFIRWEKISIPLSFVKSMDITAYRDVNYGSIELLVNDAVPTFDANNKINVFAGDKISFSAKAIDGFKFVGWQITGEDGLLLNENYTIASVFEDYTELKIIAKFTKVWTVNVNFDSAENRGHLFINGAEINNGVSQIVVYHGKPNNFNFTINSGDSNYEGSLAIGKNSIENTFFVTNDSVIINASIHLKTARLMLKVGSYTQVKYKSQPEAEYVSANRNSEGDIVIDRPIGSKLYLLVIPNTGEFTKWTINDGNGLVYDMDNSSVIRNSNGIIVMNEFEYTCSMNRTLYYNTEDVYNATIALKDNANPATKVYIDSINGVSLYTQFNPDGTPVNPYYTTNLKKGDIVVMKIILADEDMLDTSNLITSAIEQNGKVIKYTISEIYTYGNKVSIGTIRKTYNINARSEDNSFGKITISEGPYYKNSVVNLKTTVSNGYRFVGYLINNKLITDISPAGYEYTVTGESDVINILSKYEKVGSETINYNIALNNASVTGYAYQISGAGTYMSGTAVSVLFESDELDFVGWYDGDTCLSTSARYNFICTKNITLTPRAKIKSFTVTKNDSNNKMISILPERVDGIYKIGEEITLNYSAIGLQQNNFGYWTNYGFKMDGNSSSAKFTFKVTENLVVDAYVTPKSNVSDETGIVYYKVSYNPNDNAMGITKSTNGSEFIEGGMTQLKAVPHNGYEFLYWEENGVRLTYNDTYILENISSDMDFIAVFQPVKRDIIYSTNNASGGNYAGVTKAITGSDQQIIIDAKLGYRIDSVTVNGVPVDISNGKTAIVNLSNIDGTQNVSINYKKTGLSSREWIVVGGAGGMVLIFVIGLFVILFAKPNKTKLARLVSARRNALAIIGAAGPEGEDDESYDEEEE